MPEICRFYGIVIKMHYDDHPPPHIHAEYGDYKALINIYSMGIIAGKLPHRALGLVTEWLAIHQEELMELWQKAKKIC